MNDDHVEVPEPETVRRIHRTIEPYHAIVYFASEGAEVYGRLGLDARSGYFASRAAPLGAVPAEVVTATFYNFAPRLVHRAMQGVWDHTTPTAVLEARLEVADRALRSHLGDDVIGSEGIRRAAELARAVATEAQHELEGRPLFAAHAALDWPEAPHLVLWHAVTLLREYRGDAHIAALLTTGLDGLGAVVIHAASHQIPEAFLRATRGWPSDAWVDAVALYRRTGWIAVDDGPDGVPVLTPEGAEQREAIETATDRTSTLPWMVIGTDGIEELASLVRPWADALSEAMFERFRS